MLGKTLHSVAVRWISESYCWGVRSYMRYSVFWIVAMTGSSRAGRAMKFGVRMEEAILAPPGKTMRVWPSGSLRYHCSRTCLDLGLSFSHAPILVISMPIERLLALVACQAA